MSFSKCFYFLTTFISAIFVFWLIASFINTNAHSISGFEIKKWNAFDLLIELKRENSSEERMYEKEKGETSREKIKNNFSKSISASVVKKDLMNLARIIHAENGSHPNDEALILTGVVILKRVKSKDFPNTILGVISQEGQYSTWLDGKFYCKPSKRSIKIARRLLDTDLADKYPDNLVFQSMFPQGKSIYKELNHECFCLA